MKVLGTFNTNNTFLNCTSYQKVTKELTFFLGIHAVLLHAVGCDAMQSLAYTSHSGTLQPFCVFPLEIWTCLSSSSTPMLGRVAMTSLLCPTTMVEWEEATVRLTHIIESIVFILLNFFSVCHWHIPLWLANSRCLCAHAHFLFSSSYVSLCTNNLNHQEKSCANVVFTTCLKSSDCSRLTSLMLTSVITGGVRSLLSNTALFDSEAHHRLCSRGCLHC